MQSIPADRAVTEGRDQEACVGSDIDGPNDGGHSNPPNRLPAAIQPSEAPFGAEDKAAAIGSDGKPPGHFILIQFEALAREGRLILVSPVLNGQAVNPGRGQPVISRRINVETALPQIEPCRRFSEYLEPKQHN